MQSAALVFRGHIPQNCSISCTSVSPNDILLFSRLRLRSSCPTYFPTSPSVCCRFLPILPRPANILHTTAYPIFPSFPRTSQASPPIWNRTYQRSFFIPCMVGPLKTSLSDFPQYIWDLVHIMFKSISFFRIFHYLCYLHPDTAHRFFSMFSSRR